jgi:SEL1 protein
LEKSLIEDLHVFEEWIPSAHGDHPQVTKSFLLWHMAAMSGNVESAMALAYRYDHNVDSNRDVMTVCQDSLPYYRAAADGIMDQLETSVHSRAKVLPPMDQHSLTKIHMHGGTSSQLDWNNKPDESKEALQFYHLKATTVPWSSRSDGGKKNEKVWRKRKGKSTGSSEGDAIKKKQEEMEGVDVTAAYTLGHLYHHGYRGVEQNLTKSLDYYEIAALNGHWESAGHACTFHLWGIGVEQDVNKALLYCRLGAPMDLNGCRLRHNAVVARSQRKDEDSEGKLAECDDIALNGLGLLHLMGVPGKIEVDLVDAEKYFTLAKELGNMDAQYNLAMMWLGWKTHFKSIDELEDGGISSAESFDGNVPLHADKKSSSGGGGGSGSSKERFALHVSKSGKDGVFKGPTQDDVNNAIKLLVTAANKGHVQAKHRLAMIYAEGIRLQTSVLKYESVKKDCLKAKGLFLWVVENASPTRSKRLKRAYQEYIAGNLEASLRNYLAAAETGSGVGQVNAAFLMERGVCLGLDSADCAKASVRLWKAAASRGNAEACLRVGDFYYYGRLRGNKFPVGPFGWIQYMLFPEKYLPAIYEDWSKKILAFAWNFLADHSPELAETVGSSSSMTCDAQDGFCLNEDATARSKEAADDILEADLHMAAHYYQVAVEKHHSARANFNLGFMHEWGLGLKQDFPLAKRHYDLAMSGNPREAELAVQLSLMALNLHETIIRWKVVLEEWWYSKSIKKITKSYDASNNHNIKAPKEHSKVGEPVPAPRSGTKMRKTREEIIMSHIFNWSSAVILILVFIAIQIMVMMKGRQRRR